MKTTDSTRQNEEGLLERNDHAAATMEGYRLYWRSSAHIVTVQTLLSSEDKKFCLKQGDNGCLRLDTSHASFYQVQTQMWLGNVKYSDFCVCTFPEGKAEASLYVERIFPDEKFWDSCVQRSTNFFSVCILPELVGRWYTSPVESRSQDLNNSKDSTSLQAPELADGHNSMQQASYQSCCYCKQPENDQTVTCENSNCLRGFHMKCLKMKSLPKRKWYCPDCRRIPKTKK